MASPSDRFRGRSCLGAVTALDPSGSAYCWVQSPPPSPSQAPKQCLGRQSGVDPPAVPATKLLHLHTEASVDWLAAPRVFGHGLSAWRGSNPALNPWLAPRMFRIGDRLPPARQNLNRPALMASLGSDLPSASDSTRDSACDGLIAVAEALEKFGIGSPRAAPLFVDAAPAAQLLRSGYSAPKPNCCGPEGRRWFPESTGVATPCSASLGLGGAVSTSDGGRYSGRSFPRSRGGPGLHVGIGPGACCVAAGGGAAVWCVAGSRRDQTVGECSITVMRARTVQMRIREARSRVPHVTSRQDSKCNVQSTSTVHRSPTINPHYPLMSLPLRPVPVLKYWDFNGHNLAVSQQNWTFQKARDIRKV